MNLIERTIYSVSWNILAKIVAIAMGLIRSICLARWLPVEVFGVYAFAASIIHLTLVLPNFGMAGALVHQSDETADPDRAARVHFSLISLFSLAWAGLVASAAAVFLERETTWAVWALVVIFLGLQFTKTPGALLIRQVRHKRLAIIQLVAVTLSTLVSVGMALGGFALPALLAVDLVTLMVTLAGLYGYRPIFRPRFDLDKQLVAYFIGFGARNVLNNLLEQVLGRGDKLWTAIMLGQKQLGFYARAFRFSAYPNLLLASAVTPVVVGTFAEVKHDPLRLARLFSHTSGILIRSGFLLTGVFAVIAPELIVLLIGEKWLPMLNAFRLLLLFSLFDPVRLILNSLYIAVGRPGDLVRVRICQLVLFGVLISILGNIWGIAGVAMTMILMLFSGLTLLLIKSRQFLSFSLKKILLPPVVSAVCGAGAVLLLNPLWDGISSAPALILSKSLCYGLFFIGVCCCLEGRYLIRAFQTIRRNINPKGL